MLRFLDFSNPYDLKFLKKPHPGKSSSNQKLDKEEMKLRFYKKVNHPVPIPDEDKKLT